MSYGTPRILVGISAGADLSADANIGRAVKLTADNTIGLCSAGTDNAIGVLQCGNTIGKFVEVCGIGGGAQGKAGAVVAAGTELASNASGDLIAAVATNKVIAISMEAATTIGDIINVEVVNYYK